MKIKRITVLKQIKKYIVKRKWSIVVMTVSNAVLVPLSLANPKLFQMLIDDVMNAGDFSKFTFIAVAYLSVYFLNLLFDSLNLYCGNRLLNHFTLSLREDIWVKYSKSNYSDIEKMQLGDLKMRIMDDVDCLGNFMQSQIMEYFFSVLMIVFTLLMTFSINIEMTLYCLIVIPFVFIINSILSRGSGKVNEEIRQVNEEYYTHTYNSLQFWKEIKAHNAENEFIKRFKVFRARLAKLGIKNIRYWAFWEIFNDFKANYLTKVLVYIIGAFFVIQEKISVGVMIMFAEYFSLLFTALDTVNYKRAELKMNTPYYKRIFETQAMNQENDENKWTNRLVGNISFENVTFSYSNSKHEVLKNINFEINQGDYIAIIGESGCGKTTLAKLLLGLYSPQKGQIKIDGININDWAKSALYSNIGIVMQDSFFFNMSIRENLCIAKADSTDDELKDACQKANIYDFICSLENGFNTVIGERGIKLSGGQKQRLAIAQVLLRKPKVIIFDEVTSALDKVSEDVILQSISEISKKTSVIFITHKPATVLRAKKVIVMDKGEIIDIGSHEELMRKNEFFQSVVEAS
ncbi:MAG: ABC transporter ATP-binding protein [Bacillota bacterium]|nr:ABC transporter ATP-binding protein [Bacillota bacterium]